jgi:hypothetical protein
MSILPNRKPPPLDVAMIEDLRARIDQFIDDRAAQLKIQSPGVPLLVLRNILVARSSGCQCLAFIHIAELDEADADLKARQQKAAKV